MWRARSKSYILFELCKFSFSTHPLPLFFDFVCLHSVILILLLFKKKFDSHVCNFFLKHSQSVSTCPLLSAHSADYDWLCVDPCGIIMHYSGQITHPEMIRLGIIVTVARPGLTLSHQDTRHLLSLSLLGRSLVWDQEQCPHPAAARRQLIICHTAAHCGTIHGDNFEPPPSIFHHHFSRS